MMMNYDSLVMQLHAALQKKSDLDKHINAVKRDLLATPELQAQVAPLHNSGGEKTEAGITVEVAKKHIWQQEMLAAVLNEMPEDEWPPFVTRQAIFKIDMRKFANAAVSNPSLVQPFNSAHSIKLSDPKISKVKLGERE